MKLLRWQSGQLFYNDGQGWKLYSSHPLSKPDYQIGSKGFATAQFLLSRCNYTYEQFNTQESNGEKA